MLIVDAVIAGSQRIKKVEFVDLKPVKPKKFKVELMMMFIRNLNPHLKIENWDPDGDTLYVDFDDPVPSEEIPDFCINFKLFAAELGSSGDSERIVIEAALDQVLASLETTKVVFTKKAEEVGVQLSLGKTVLEGTIDAHWAEHFFNMD